MISYDFDYKSEEDLQDVFCNQETSCINSEQQLLQNITLLQNYYKRKRIITTENKSKLSKRFNCFICKAAFENNNSLKFELKIPKYITKLQIYY